MSDPEEVAQQRVLLETYRQTLHHYLRQQAALSGAYTPPGVALGITEARAEIKRIKTALRQKGVIVPDQQDDEALVNAPKIAPAPAPQRRGTGLVGIVVIGGIVLLLAWFGRIIFVRTGATQLLPNTGVTQTDSVAQSSSSPTASSSITQSSPNLAVGLPEGDMVTVLYGVAGKATYKILSATIQPLDARKVILHLSIRVEILEGIGLNFFADDFRLKVNDQSSRSESYINEEVHVGETKDGVVDFPIPNQPIQAHLVVVTGKTPATLLLDIKAPGQESAIPSPTPNLTVSLPQGDTVVIPNKVGQMTFQILSAEVQRLSPGQSLLHLVIRATSGFSTEQMFSTDGFRLRINDQGLSASNYFVEGVLPSDTKDGVVEFPIPTEPVQARLTFDIGFGPQAELPLEIK